jgi:hypothetical protein
MDRETYDRLWNDAAAMRQYLDELLKSCPELFPAGVEHGFRRLGQYEFQRPGAESADAAPLDPPLRRDDETLLHLRRRSHVYEHGRGPGLRRRAGDGPPAPAALLPRRPHCYAGALNTGPRLDPSECIGACVSNGRIFYTGHGGGLQVALLYGQEAMSAAEKQGGCDMPTWGRLPICRTIVRSISSTLKKF